jgi:gliding motility-associated lipoprotein GldH
VNRFGILTSAFFILITLAFYSCAEEEVAFEENKAIKGNNWSMDKPVIFKVDMDDTVTRYNMFFNLRTTTSYEYSNLYVFLTRTYPNGFKEKDTLHFKLAEYDGHWTGKSSGEMVENRIKFMRDARFPIRGKYIFKFEQAMRDEDLAEVASVGLRIERVD